MVLLLEAEDLRKPIRSQIHNLDPEKIGVSHFIEGAVTALAHAHLAAFVYNGYAHILKDRKGGRRTITVTELAGIIEEEGL